MPIHDEAYKPSLAVVIGMHAIGLVDVPDSLVEELADALSTRGQLGMVRHRNETTTIDVDGDWEVLVSDVDIHETLDVLAPRCDYAILEGFELSRGPTLTASDGMIRGSLIEEPTAVDTLDVGELVSALHDMQPYVTLEALVEELKSHPNEVLSGAIATFTGRVRAKENHDDTATEYLEFEQYGGVAEETMETIREELTDRDGVFEVLLHHRSGVISASEDIVFVVVLAGHREEAFRTVEDGINRLKAEVPIFKKEVTIDEEYWVHNRP